MLDAAIVTHASSGNWLLPVCDRYRCPRLTLGAASVTSGVSFACAAVRTSGGPNPTLVGGKTQFAAWPWVAVL